MLDSWEAYLADPIRCELPSISLTRVEAEQGWFLLGYYQTNVPEKMQKEGLKR